MNMEEQFQRFVDSQSGGGSDGFTYRAPQPPPSLHFSPSRLPQKGPWSRSLGLSISQQVYKYVKWILDRVSTRSQPGMQRLALYLKLRWQVFTDR